MASRRLTKAQADALDRRPFVVKWNADADAIREAGRWGWEPCTSNYMAVRERDVSRLPDHLPYTDRPDIPSLKLWERMPPAHIIERHEAMAHAAAPEA